jgi:hypothetical protein
MANLRRTTGATKPTSAAPNATRRTRELRKAG